MMLVFKNLKGVHALDQLMFIHIGTVDCYTYPIINLAFLFYYLQHEQYQRQRQRQQER